MIRAAIATVITLALVYALQHLPAGDLHDVVELFAGLWAIGAVGALLGGQGR